MGIYGVGTLESVASIGATRRDIATQAVGNLLLLSVQVGNGAQVTGVRTLGNTTANNSWARVAGPYRPPGHSENLEIWAAAVSARGYDTVVVSFGSDVSRTYAELDVQEVGAGLGSSTTWQADTWAGVSSLDPTSNTINFPELSPATPGELYFGHGFGSPQARGDALTSGFVYQVNNGYDLTIYNPNVSGDVRPTGRMASPSTSAAIAVLIAVVTSTTVTGPGGSKTVTTLSSATLSGSGALGGAAILHAAAPTGISLQGAGRLTGYEGAGTPPAPAATPPPPPPPFAPQPPTTAGLALYDEMGPLTVGDADLGFPLLTFADAAAGSMLQVLDDLCRDTVGGPGWSQVMDPTRAPEYALPWLGQFVGVGVDAGLVDADQRSQLTGEAGFARGTLAAIQAAANKYLKAGQSATITERDGDPYTLTVRVYDGNVDPRSYADVAVSYPTYNAFAAAFATYQALSVSLAQVKAAVIAAKPAGLIANVILQGFATVAGSGRLTGVVASTSTAALAGAGRLIGAVASTVTAAFAGAGAIVGTLTKLGPNALVGSGSLSGVPLNIEVETSVLNGRGALSGSPVDTVPEAATLSGSGTLSGAPSQHTLPQLVASYPASSGSNGTGTLTTATFTPAAGEILVVKATSGDQPCAVGAVSGGGLTWTLQISLSAGSNDPVKVWTATAPASPSAMAVSVTFSGTGNSRSVIVERWGNAVLAASPAVGASQGNTSALQTVNTVGGASIVTWVDSDWNVAGGSSPSVAYRGAGAVSIATHLLGGCNVYYAYQPAPTPGSQTFGLSSPTGQKASLVGIEIQSATG